MLSAIWDDRDELDKQDETLDHSKPPRAAHLSATQRECLRLVEIGKSSDEIAEILNISKAAVVQCVAVARRAPVADHRLPCDAAAPPLNGTLASGGPQDYRSPGSMLDELSIAYDFDVEHDLAGPPMSVVDAEGRWSTAKKIAIIVVLTIGTLAIALIGLSVSQSVSGLLTG
ncbi:LuxR C-terminal-related transcriptional regulator [Parasphingorhabdus sp.]|uniref:LuxR C-terminal-related transcriptional regulator n=1 Tax=Parasphingorhabdus sp. TaxID=2709688 RepID=UPI003A8CFDAE